MTDTDTDTDTEEFDITQQVVEIFHESVEAKIQAIESLAPHIADAADLLVQCLLDDGKIMVCGNGTSGTTAQQFTANLITRPEKERPSLPAICLNTDIITLGAVANNHNFNEVYSKQIRALGKPGDALLVITTNSSSNSLVHAIQAAHDREMNVIIICGQEGGDIAAILTAEDIELRVPNNSIARIHEIQLLTIFCLCDLIDEQIFGSTD